jgi:hypothetical protein
MPMKAHQGGEHHIKDLDLELPECDQIAALEQRVEQALRAYAATHGIPYTWMASDIAELAKYQRDVERAAFNAAMDRYFKPSKTWMTELENALDFARAGVRQEHRRKIALRPSHVELLQHVGFAGISQLPR